MAIPTPEQFLIAALAEDGQPVSAGGPPWRSLGKVGPKTEHADEPGGQCRNCGAPVQITTEHPTLASGLAVAEVLRIAHQDAQAVYRDLSGFKITLMPCPDGWHVDYDLTDALSVSGGPHYVIDPDTGTILTRRYEQ